MVSCTNNEILNHESNDRNDYVLKSTDNFYEMQSFLDQTGINEIILYNRGWEETIKNYKANVEKFESNPLLPQYKMNLINYLIIQTDYLENAKTNELLSLYKEFDQYSKGGLKAKYLMLKKLQLDLEPKEILNLKENVTQRGLEALSIKKEKMKQWDENIKSQNLELDFESQMAYDMSKQSIVETEAYIQKIDFLENKN
jgi:hypothetical protein